MLIALPLVLSFIFNFSIFYTSLNMQTLVLRINRLLLVTF